MSFFETPLFVVQENPKENRFLAGPLKRHTPVAVAGSAGWEHPINYLPQRFTPGKPPRHPRLSVAFVGCTWTSANEPFEGTASRSPVILWIDKILRTTW